MITPRYILSYEIVLSLGTKRCEFGDNSISVMD